ncbi:MAG: hypothetical protein KatS3mg031_0415 [Chitinophagales bacterium]|nr:MAG: hypothetical protein KatS3mg031_0415 [Chitinophagales bacterium]
MRTFHLFTLGILCILCIVNLSAYGQIIVIDPGHGVYASCQNCDRPDGEVLTVMAVALKLRDTIQTHCSWTVYLTRTSNACGQCPTLTQRETMSNSWGADRFLSIHANAGGGTGTETFWCNVSPSNDAAAQAFATAVQNQMVSYGQWANRRVVEDNTYLGFHLGVLDNNNAIGCLNEIGFFDNPSDLAKLQDAYWQGQFAKAYYMALQNDLQSFCSGSISSPANDNCAQAQQLISSLSCQPVGGSVAGATVSGLPQPTCDGFSGPSLKDVWFVFQAIQPTHTITVAGSSDFDAVLSLYTACNQEVACVDTGGLGGVERITTSALIPGNLYYVRIYDYGTLDPLTPDFDICIAHPPAPALPDLVITQGSVTPAVSLPGGVITLEYTISNVGPGSVNATTEIGYYLMNLTQGCPVHIPQMPHFNGGTLTVSEMSDNSETEMHQVNIPGSTSPGGYYLVVAADQFNTLAEADEQNNVYCIPFSVAAALTVTGTVYTEAGMPVEGVTLMADCGPMTVVTDSAGHFAFSNLPSSGCTLTPFRGHDADIMNGLSILDVALIKRHFAGKGFLNSPYKILAADVDGDDVVSSSDLPHITALLLGYEETLPGHRIWRFLPSGKIFSDSLHPFAEATDSFLVITSAGTFTNQDFIAIKLGDVNQSWDPQIAKTSLPLPAAVLFADSAGGLPGRQVEISVRGLRFQNILSMQGTLLFDTAVARVDSITYMGLPGLSVVGFGLNEIPFGKIRYAWYDTSLTGVTRPDSAVLFTMRFTLKGNAGAETPVVFASNPLALEVSDSGFQEITAIYYDGLIQITDSMTAFRADQFSDRMHGHMQIIPNPHSGTFGIHLYPMLSVDGQLSLLNALGQTLRLFPPASISDYCNMAFDISDLPQGTYFLKLTMRDQQLLAPMVYMPKP